MITLKNLGEATPIQVFNQAKEHLLKQMQKSLTEDGFTCMYRSFDGLKCAAGCFIADDEYDEQMEDKSWGQVSNRFYGKFVDIFSHENLISQLQLIHDRHPTEEWECELSKLEVDVLAGKYDE